jgi:hypothetical protein
MAGLNQLQFDFQVKKAFHIYTPLTSTSAECVPTNVHTKAETNAVCFALSGVGLAYVHFSLRRDHHVQ